MGEPALVAYKRPDGTYSCHYSNRGGATLALGSQITEATPFAGDAPTEVERTYYDHYQTAAETDSPVGVAPEKTSQRQRIKYIPVRVGVGFETVLTNFLNYERYQAMYVVSREFDVTPYRVFWFGFEDVTTRVASSPRIGHGAVVSVRWCDGGSAGDERLRGWFEGAKEILGAMFDRDELTPERAVTVLHDRLASRLRPSQDLHVVCAD